MKGTLKDYIYQPEYECLSRSEMENLQSERLRKTVELVYNQCKPYRAKMDEYKIKPSDIRSVSDLSKLPFTVSRSACVERYDGKADRCRVHAERY